MSTNELNPCRYTRYFSFANAEIVKLFFLKLFSFLASFSYFDFRTFVFSGTIPYGKIIPLYLNRVVRLTPVIIAKIDSWTGLLVNPRACKVGPLYCLFEVLLCKIAPRKRSNYLKFLSRVEIIGEVCCSPHYDPLVRSEKGALLGMIYRVISQFS